MDEEAWIAAVRADLEAEVGDEAAEWLRSAPMWQSYAGLERYWRKRREREDAA